MATLAHLPNGSIVAQWQVRTSSRSNNLATQALSSWQENMLRLLGSSIDLKLHISCQIAVKLHLLKTSGVV